MLLIAVVHELRVALLGHDEQGRKLSLLDVSRELDEYLLSVIEGPQGFPGCTALDGVVEVEIRDLEVRYDVHLRVINGIDPVRNTSKLVLGVIPGHTCLVGFIEALALKVIDMLVSRYSDVSVKVRNVWFQKDVHSLVLSSPACSNVQ